jgi:hypothetical protein
MKGILARINGAQRQGGAKNANSNQALCAIGNMQYK